MCVGGVEPRPCVPLHRPAGRVDVEAHGRPQGQGLPRPLQVIFPEGNKPDWEELAKDLKEDLTPHFVSSYDEVSRAAL